MSRSKNQWVFCNINKNYRICEQSEEYSNVPLETEDIKLIGS